MVRKQIEFPVPADPRSDILDYMVRDTIDGVDLAISASLPYEYPVSMHIPALKWEIFCPDCDTSMVKVSSVTTSSIFLQPYRYFIVSVVAEIPRFPRNIVASCPDGRSPLDVLVQETLAAKKMKVYVRASKFQNEDLPGWVVYAMSKVFVPVAFAAPQLSVEVPLTEFKIRNTIITIPSVDGYQPFLDSNVTFLVGIPKESHCVVELLGLRGRFEVEHQGETLGGVYIESMQPVKSSMDRDLTISVFEKDGRCFTGNDVAIANILQRFLDGKSSRVSIISTGDVKLSLALLESTIRGISGTAMATLLGWNTTFPALRPEPMIQNITFLQSSPNMIQVRVLVETNNQLDISLKMDELDIFFGSKKALFGHATVHRIQMEARKRFVFTVDVTLDPLSYLDEGFRQLSLFASSYISGIDQTIKLEGHSGSVPTSLNISNILSHLSVELSVPEIKYPLNMGSRNPFIISSIMHVMTMEVEVVVYNPMSNMDVIITVDSAEAIYEGNIVGCIDHAETVTAPPGISTTRKISVSPRNGLVRDALLKLVNRKVQVDCLCRITASIGGFSLDLIFTGSGIETEIRM
ncbi:hypothetical protein BABINDRAFT_10549 [Babjeviella inositovora NRRL Y-12698]|uniref:Tag1-like fifth Ig-like domain-containing protein n=1 Tax=Babjeviella inositovora NRRL Y-12698 TaxID=984486 RepID=A0A1E3QJ60_9ASCO|nr:uncharacterized protein BABINDRAFT_10549 [Babjeviella inositovora NRRL Y-12698]ODQ77017.1 hypothetical protein BABINDRAFT_10549 [Babjeviella inositovora NRRL Y-12698]